MNDRELDLKAKATAQNIHRQSLVLIEYLIEIDRRKSFADHSFSSLFTYIVKFLGFSEAQAAVYNNIVKAKVVVSQPVKKMLSQGDLSLSTLGVACQHIKNNKEKFDTEEKKTNLIESVKGMSKNEAKRLLPSPNKVTSPIKVKLNEKTIKNLQRIKKKLKNLNMSDGEVISYLANKELNEGKEIKENKVITPRTKEILLRNAQHRCEYVGENGKRCEASSHLEVEHLMPRAKEVETIRII